MKQSNDSTKKDLRTSYTEKGTNKQASTILKELKQKSEAMVLIPIDFRTSIEVPASFTQAEREERVANYIRVHSPE